MRAAAFALLCLLVLGHEGLAGQSIHGLVVSSDTVPVPVAGANLTLVDSAGRTVAQAQASDAGEFRLPVPHPGRYEIGASRIGFSTVRASVLVGEGEAVEVRLSMAVEAVPLEPLEVVGRRAIRSGTLDEFYDRMAHMRQKGQGQFLTREQLEQRERTPLPFVLQSIPGVWLDEGGRSVSLRNNSAFGAAMCQPEFYLDGMPMVGGYREIQVMDLEGVEVYRGYSELVHGYFPNSCGIIMLWRRPGWGNPFTWGRFFLAAGLSAGIWLVLF